MFLLFTFNFPNFKYINYSHIVLIICLQSLFLDIHHSWRKSGMPDRVPNLQSMVSCLALNRHSILNKCLLTECYSDSFHYSPCSSCSHSSVRPQSRGQEHFLQRPAVGKRFLHSLAFELHPEGYGRFCEVCRVGKNSMSSTKADMELCKYMLCLGSSHR